MQFEEKKSSVDLVVDALIEYIMANGLKAGDRLPNGKDLCALLNVSLGTLRESIQRLAVRNVLEVRRSVGVFVSPKNGTSDDPLGFALVRDRTKLIQDLADFRLVIEPRAAAMAAQNRTDEQLDSLREAVEFQEFYLEKHDADRIKSMDSRFHETVFKMSGSAIFYDVLLPLHKKILKYRRASVSNTSRAEASVAEHHAIYEAIAASNSTLAEKLIIEHLDNAYMHMKG